jgi:hypothetical protein
MAEKYSKDVQTTDMDLARFVGEVQEEIDHRRAEKAKGKPLKPQSITVRSCMNSSLLHIALTADSTGIFKSRPIGSGAFRLVVSVIISI